MYTFQDDAVADGFTHSGTSFFMPVWIEIDEEGEVVEVEAKWFFMEWVLDWCWETEFELFGSNGDKLSFSLVVKKKIEIGLE